MISKFRCPCCRNLTLSEKRMFEICDVCGWEDDNVQFDDPDFAGGANHFSLNKYRELYLQGKNPFQMEQELIKNDVLKCEEEAKRKQEEY